MTIFYLILLALLCLALYDQNKQLEQKKADYEKLNRDFTSAKKENESLYASLIAAEKATQQAEICAKGHEITIAALQRELEVRGQLLKQLDRRNGNE